MTAYQILSLTQMSYKTQAGLRSKVIRVRVRPDTLTWVESQCGIYNLSVSEYVRILLLKAQLDEKDGGGVYDLGEEADCDEQDFEEIPDE